MHKGFTCKYNLHKLVYLEVYEDEKTAIEREKYLKKCYKKTKKKLIAEQNPQWNDLCNGMVSAVDADTYPPRCHKLRGSFVFNTR